MAGKFAEKYSDHLFGGGDAQSVLEYSTLESSEDNIITTSADKAKIQYNTLEISSFENLLTISADKTELNYETILPLVRGIRRLPTKDLTTVGVVESSVVQWEATLDSIKHEIIFETSTDGGNTWQEVSNQGSIPQLSPGDNVLGTKLDVRQILTSIDLTSTPSLEFSEVIIRSKFSGKDTAVSSSVQSSSITNDELVNDSVTVTSGDGLKNGGTVALGNSITINIEPSDFAGNALEDDGSDNLALSSNSVGSNELNNDTVTIANNSVSLGSSVGVALGDLSDIGTVNVTSGHILVGDGNDFDTKNINDVTENNVNIADLKDVDTTVKNNQLTNSSVTITAGDGIKNAGSVSLGGSITIDVEPADFAGNALEDDGTGDLSVKSNSIDSDELANDTVTVAGNSISLGGSTSVNHSDLSSVNSGDHHNQSHDNSDHSTDMVEDNTTTGNAPYKIEKNGTDGTGIINFKT